MFGWRFWGLSVLYALGAALVIGVPTVLISTPFFHRMTPTSGQDYLIWAISAALLGPVLALATLYPTVSTSRGTSTHAGGWRAAAGAWLSVFSVGCPICNKIVVLLLGLSGAMTIFNPLRPFLGAASIALLSVTLLLRVRVVQRGCPVSRPSLIGPKRRKEPAARREETISARPGEV